LKVGGTKTKQMITPQSIRKGIIIKFDGVEVDKATIIKASEEWKESHETLFKKLLKQGGSFRINGVLVEVKPIEKALNSKGELTINLPPSDPLARF
jgi:translation elongation factor P/translation initiation factor 5A